MTAKIQSLGKILLVIVLIGSMVRIHQLGGLNSILRYLKGIGGPSVESVVRL